MLGCTVVQPKLPQCNQNHHGVTEIPVACIYKWADAPRCIPTGGAEFQSGKTDK